MTTIEETIDLILNEFVKSKAKTILSSDLENKLEIPFNTFETVIEKMVAEKLINGSSTTIYLKITSFGEEIQNVGGYKKWQKEEVKIRKSPVYNYRLYIIFSIITLIITIIIYWENIIKLF